MRPIFCVLVLTAVAVSGQRLRQGRQQTAGTGYGAPPPAPRPVQDQPEYGGLSQASDVSSSSHDHQGLDWLLNSVPGTPGTDYPILAEVPETSFSCSGLVEGGYYADTDTDCQAFHVCTTDGQGGLSKHSFLCPNGTIFNQNYFICDWWFNFDCSGAAELYSLNEQVAAEREAASQGSQASASANSNSYAAPSQAQAQYTGK